jgi:hypothetical protein
MTLYSLPSLKSKEEIPIYVFLKGEQTTSSWARLLRSGLSKRSQLGLGFSEPNSYRISSVSYAVKHSYPPGDNE